MTDHNEQPIPEPDDNRGHEMLGWLILFVALCYVALCVLLWWMLI